MIYAIFETASGAIRAVLHGSLADAQANCPAGCDLLESPAELDFGLHYVKGGAFTVMPPRPSSHHSFDYTLEQWADTRPLPARQAQKWDEIKVARTAAEFGPFEYGGFVLDGDVDSQRRLATYISVSKSALAQGVPFEASWTLANNTQTTFTAFDFVAIEAAKALQVAAAFLKAVALRELIYAADATFNSVESVTW